VSSAGSAAASTTTVVSTVVVTAISAAPRRKSACAVACRHRITRYPADPRILQREELAITEQSGDQDKVTPAVDDESEPADDPWQGFPLDDVVYRGE
jgi:hypothetical protein